MPVRAEGALDQFNGAADDQDPNTLYFNTATPIKESPIPLVIGHELGHAVERDLGDDNEAVREFRAAHRAAFAPDAVERYVQSYASSTGTRLNQMTPQQRAAYTEKVMAEHRADFTGEQLIDPTFWDRLARHSPGVFRKTARAFMRMIDQIKQALHVGPSYQAKKWLRENKVEELREKLAAMLAQYQREGGRVEEWKPRAPRQKAPEVILSLANMQDSTIATRIIDAGGFTESLAGELRAMGAFDGLSPYRVRKLAPEGGGPVDADTVAEAVAGHPEAFGGFREVDAYGRPSDMDEVRQWIADSLNVKVSTGKNAERKAARAEAGVDEQYERDQAYREYERQWMTPEERARADAEEEDRREDEEERAAIQSEGEDYRDAGEGGDDLPFMRRRAASADFFGQSREEAERDVPERDFGKREAKETGKPADDLSQIMQARQPEAPRGTSPVRGQGELFGASAFSDAAGNTPSAEAKVGQARGLKDQGELFPDEPRGRGMLFQARRGEEKPTGEKYKFSSTQVNLPRADAQAVAQAATRIDKEDLGENGRETEPHVTVKYGLHTADAEEVRRVLANEGPITLTLGKTSTFPPSEGSDGQEVVKVDVDSPDLHRLNKKIADTLPHTDSFPNYKPHVTLAYVKPGMGRKYAGQDWLEGRQITLDRIVFSGKNGDKVEIPLNGSKGNSSEIPNGSMRGRRVDSGDRDAQNSPMKPRRKKLYRGEGLAGGTGVYKYGKGKYSTPSKGFAGEYGEVSEVEDGWPENPLVIPGSMSFEDWLLRESGERNMRAFNQKYADPGEFVRSKGYDGVIDGDVVVRYSTPDIRFSARRRTMTPEEEAALNEPPPQEPPQDPGKPVRQPYQPEPGSFGPNLAMTGYYREQYEMGEREPFETESREELRQRALDLHREDPEAAANLVMRLQDDPDKTVKSKDVMLLAVYAKDLDDRMKSVVASMKEAAASGNKDLADQHRQRADDLLAKLKEVYEVIESSGRDTARALGIKASLLKEDYSLGRMMHIMEVQVSGEPLSGEQKAFVETLNAKIKDLTERLEAAERDAEAKGREAAMAREEARLKAEKQAAPRRGVSDYSHNRFVRKAEADALLPRLKQVDLSKLDFSKVQFMARRKAKELGEAFKRWFGESKVVDADGEPLVVYHGTPKPGFTAFDRQYVSRNYNLMLVDGFYFTPSMDAALHYTRGAQEGGIIQAFLRLENPLRVSSVRELRDSIFNNRNQGSRYEQEQRAGMRDSEILESMGYDGIIYSLNGEMREIVAFSPTQIKSATGNNGDFDPQNSDIRFMARREATDERQALIDYSLYHYESLGQRGPWEEALLANLGEGIRPHLTGLWKATQDEFRTRERAEIVERMKRAIANKRQPETLRNQARALARSFVMEGIEEREALVDAVHAEMKAIAPGITRDQTMDAISGYGDYRQLSKDEISEKVRDLAGQMQQVAKLRDLKEKNGVLQPTGFEHRTPSGEERRLIQQVNEEKKKYDNPESKLSSALQASKRRMQNQIDDIATQVLEHKRTVATKSDVQYDLEAYELEAKLKVMREIYEGVFGKREITDEQRLRRAIKATERQASELDRRIREGDLFPGKKEAVRLSGPALEAAQARRDALRKELEHLREVADAQDPSRKNAIALRAMETRLAHEIADLKERKARGDFEPKRRREVEPSELAKRLRFEREMALREFNEGLLKARLASRTKWQKALGGVGEVVNGLRSLMTSVDLSAVLRQGGFTVLGHPLRAARLFPTMFKAMRSEAGKFEVERAILEHKHYHLAKRAGLDLTDFGPAVSIAQLEEAYMSRNIEKVWLVGSVVGYSRRAYSGFLNALRMDSFGAMVDAVLKDNGGKIDPKQAKALAGHINDATGRTSLGAKNGAALAGLSTFLWAPRLYASRIKLLPGVATGGLLPAALAPRGTRKIIAGEYARFIIGASVVYAIGAAMGGDLEDDELSSDFGKIRFGNTRVDPLAGLQQFTVFLSRAYQGKYTDRGGATLPLRGEDAPYGGYDAGKLAMNFLRSKLNPVAGTVADFYLGRDFEGDPVTVAGEFKKLIPMAPRDIFEALMEHGMAKGSALGMLALLGAGVSTYETDPGARGRSLVKEHDYLKGLKQRTPEQQARLEKLAGSDDWRVRKARQVGRWIKAAEERGDKPELERLGKLADELAPEQGE